MEIGRNIECCRRSEKLGFLKFWRWRRENLRLRIERGRRRVETKEVEEEIERSNIALSIFTRF